MGQLDESGGLGKKPLIPGWPWGYYLIPSNADGEFL
jgi:hypothetical protein